MTLFLYHKIGVHTVFIYTLRDKGVTDNYKLKGLLAYIILVSSKTKDINNINI